MAFDASQILGHFGTQGAVFDCAGLRWGPIPQRTFYILILWTLCPKSRNHTKSQKGPKEGSIPSIRSILARCSVAAHSLYTRYSFLRALCLSSKIHGYRLFLTAFSLNRFSLSLY